MGGWKTWAAAGGLCLLGLALIGMGLLATELRAVLFALGLQAILFGFGLVGIGHKVEKNAAANHDLPPKAIVIAENYGSSSGSTDAR